MSTVNIPVNELLVSSIQTSSSVKHKNITNKLLYIYTIGVGFIILGLYLRFETSFKYTAVVTYSIGWILISIILFIKNKSHQILKHSIISCIMISLFWILIDLRQQTTESKNSNLPLISFSVLFLYLAYILILKSFNNVISIITASFFLIISEYVILPIQRQHNIKDGIGLPLFFLGIFILFNVDPSQKT
jgi:hypothetical protein